MTRSGQLRIVSARRDASRDATTQYLFDELGPDDWVWLAILDDQVIGGLRLTLASGATGVEVIGANVMVHTVSVHEPRRGTGHGRAVMEFAEQWLRTRPDLPTTLSLAVEVDNTTAMGLYESLGYRFIGVDGERLTTPDRRCFVMAKSLDA